MLLTVGRREAVTQDTMQRREEREEGKVMRKRTSNSGNHRADLKAHGFDPQVFMCRKV